MQVPGRVSVMRCVFILFIYVIHILIYIAMSNLFLFTFVMLVITFFIGFFVALIIKVIASWADLLDFCQLHREELAEIKRAKKLRRQAVAVAVQAGRENLIVKKNQHAAHRLQEVVSGVKSDKRAAV